MDQEMKIEPAESNCFAELEEETFIKVENVCKPKLETNEYALLEIEIKSEISNVNENCSKIEPNPPIKTEKEEAKISEPPTTLTCKPLKEIVRKGQEFTHFIKKQDLNVERQSKIIKIIDDSLRCYKEETKEKSRNVVKQTKVYNFFTKLSSKPKESSQNSNSSNFGQDSSDSGQSSIKSGQNSDAEKFHEEKKFETKGLFMREKVRILMSIRKSTRMIPK